MRIYRIEDNLGQGVYSKGSIGFTANAAVLARDAGRPVTTQHPSPDDDEGLKAWWEGPWKHWSKKKADWHYRGRKAYCCGFKDEAQMLTWFPREGFREMIKDACDWVAGGQLMVNIYEVHGRRVKRGEHQVMFRKEDATLVETLPLTHYSG